MKNFSAFYALLLAATFGTIEMTNAMEQAEQTKQAPKQQKQQIMKLISAEAAIPMSVMPQQSLKAHFNGNNPPLCMVGTMQMPNQLTPSQANAVIENCAKNNPDIAEALKDLDQRTLFMTQVMENKTPITVPFAYLIDKKPGTVFYTGLAKDNDQDGLKISEIEGTKVTDTLLHSQNSNDPCFVPQGSCITYIATEKFAKDANRAARRFDDDLRNQELSSIGRYRVNSDYSTGIIVSGRQQLGDEYGVTSGWNGGKALMDIEKRDTSVRHR